MATIRERNGTWQASIRRKGYRAIHRTFDSQQEAVEWAETVELQIKQNRYVETSGIENTPVREALRRYQREVVPTLKGAKQASNRINQLCNLPLTDRSMSELNSMHIARYRDEMIANGYAPSTIKNMLSLISRMYNVAITEWGFTGINNPVSNIKRPKAKPRRDRRLEPGEEEKLLAELDSPYREMVLLLIETAMRRGSLFKLRWQDIDFARRYLVLMDTKNGKNLKVPLSRKSIELLKSLPRHISGQVFNCNPDTLTHNLIKARRKAGIKNLTVHDLRHEGVSRLAELGTLTPAQMASITGQSLEMMMSYTHLNPTDIAEKLG